MLTPEVAAAAESIEWTHERVRTVLETLTDEQVAGASRLPGWTRGHVLAHMAGFGEGAIRQVERAIARHEPGEFYDGGQAARNAAIDASAGAPCAAHAARLGAAMDRWEGLVDLLEPELAARPTAYRDRPVGALVLSWWREMSIHLTDLDLGVTHTFWGAALREHLTGYLGARLPEGVQLDLEPTDVDEPRRVGQGSVLRLRGTANDLVAWLAGRDPLGVIVAERDGEPAELPELGPWP